MKKQLSIGEYPVRRYKSMETRPKTGFNKKKRKETNPYQKQETKRNILENLEQNNKGRKQKEMRLK